MSIVTKADTEAFASFDRLPDAAYVRVGVVAALYSVTTVSIWRWSNDGLIPKPRKIGPQVTAWNVGQLRECLKGEIGQSAASQPTCRRCGAELPKGHARKYCDDTCLNGARRDRDHPGGFAPRSMRVVREYLKGRSFKDIAKDEGLSPSTISGMVDSGLNAFVKDVADGVPSAVADLAPMLEAATPRRREKLSRRVEFSRQWAADRRA